MTLHSPARHASFLRHSTQYRSYIRSAQWLRSPARLGALRRDGYRCVRCGAGERLEVHHKTYVRLGQEWVSDLQTLCKQCHQHVHGKTKKNFNPFQGSQNAAKTRTAWFSFNPSISIPSIQGSQSSKISLIDSLTVSIIRLRRRVF